MNFLSHFFTGSIENRPYYNFGLVLPDFMGVSKRGWKFPHAELSDHENLLLPQLTEGMKTHIKGDALFHSSDFFKQSVSIFRQAFEQTAIGELNIRLFFLGHIFLELMLDRLIVKEFPQAVNDFYRDLDEVRDEVLIEFFSASMTNVPESFFDFIGRFREYKYIYSYAEDESLLYAINRIMNRGKQDAIPESMLPEFKSVIADAEVYLYQEAWPYLETLSRELR